MHCELLNLCHLDVTVVIAVIYVLPAISIFLTLTFRRRMYA